MSTNEVVALRADLSGQTAIVTGASQGIGRAISIALGRSGARVACAARNTAKLEETVAAIREAGGQGEACACDITDDASIRALVTRVAEEWGRLDILVNNAGITRDTLIPRMSDEHWDDVIRTNLRGTFLFTRAAARPMMQKRSGRIINIASVSGLKGNAGQANYSASKAAIIGLTRSVALELASRGITVNAVAPGFIETEMTAALGEQAQEEVKKHVPLKRLGVPEDVAAAVLYLASSAASYVTGQVLVVDGGLSV